MWKALRVPPLLIVLLACIAFPACAYNLVLNTESIREAYFLGQRRDDVTGKFLAQYVQTFPMPHEGPHIARIQIRTPYSQIVLDSEADGLGGSVMDAEREYRSHPAHVVVCIWIYSTPTFTPGRGWDEFWEKLSVQVQQDKPLSPLKTNYVKQPSSKGSGGTELELQFDAAQVMSAPITIDVSGPGAKGVEAKFDLARLK